MPSVRTILCLASVAAMSPVSAQLTVEPMAPVTVCGSPTLQVTFNTTDVFDPSNIFTVELSDSSGSFAVPTVIGSAAGVGAISVMCNFPVAVGSGSAWAIRVVASDPPQIGDAYVLSISTVLPPNAGTNSNLTLCSSDAPISMFQYLGGTPQVGGMWTGPNGSANANVFDPAIDPAGCFVYTVAADAPCPNASAMLCITVSQAVDLGAPMSIAACGSAPIDMGAGLPPGGFWTWTAMPHSSIFIPGVDTPGPYVYTMQGVAPCPSGTVTYTVSVSLPPDAGTGSVVSWCQTNGPVNLLAQLGGTPQLGGTWEDNNATGQLAGGVFSVAGVPSGSYSFTYTAAGGSCPDAQATVTVNLNAMCIMTPQAPYPVE